MTIKALLPLLIITLLFNVSCAKTTNGKWMVYEESACLPFWAHESSDRKSKQILSDFLKDQQIIPLKIKIVGERELNCLECYCLTGKEYHVKVDKTQIGELAYWGFELK
jgi:hypothetical protein